MSCLCSFLCKSSCFHTHIQLSKCHYDCPQVLYALDQPCQMPVPTTPQCLRGCRLAYSRWLTDAVQQLEPKASDELLILARGKSIESWKLSDIKRDDYAPNTPGLRQWEVDRKKWLAQRLLSVMKVGAWFQCICGDGYIIFPVLDYAPQHASNYLR